MITLSKLRREPPIHARLMVLLSKNPERSLVLRRGPRKRVAAFLWDRQAGSFTLGQWLKGKVYWNRADICPDGQHWIYLAMDRYGETHTVMARVPYFTAIDYYNWGDAWNGGGVFQSNSSYILNGRSLDSFKDDCRRESGFDVESRTVFVMATRLLRLGWRSIDDMHQWFQKPLRGDWHIQVDTQPSGTLGRGSSTLAHHLFNVQTGYKYARLDWEWADLLDDFLYWAENGSLWRARLHDEMCYGDPEHIHDFDPYVFETKAAPY